MRCLLLYVGILASNPLLSAQETRAASIELAREEKQGQLVPYKMPKAERRIFRLRTRWLDPLFGKSDGRHMRVGGLATGSGFALGPEYQRSDLLGGKLAIRLNSAASTRTWYQGGIEGSFPRLFDKYAFLNFSLVHRDYASMEYYGSGPDSRKTGRSNYRREDTSFEVRPGVRPNRGMRAGLIGGLARVNVGPGHNDRFISTERQFTPSETPGIDHQTSFWRGGGFVEYDWRNFPAGATRGGFYSAQYVHNSDRTLGAFSFGRIDLDVRQFVPFFNEKRVIAVRGLTSLTTTSGDQRVPFYMQPTLGGPYDLRGFRAYRFYGDNMIGTSAEYRLEASTVLEMALFVDAGKVFDRWSQWNFHGMEASYGFGFRFKSEHTPVLRVDTGFSHEGFQLWVRFNNAF